MLYKVGFISQKGGVGKSTLARALACELAKNDLKVKISDLDIQQATSVNWHRKRMINSKNINLSVECHSSVLHAISQKENFDFLILDGPAKISSGTLELAKQVDLVVQPTGASIDDLEPGVLAFHELIKHKIPKEKLVFALCKIGTKTEEKECRAYIDKAGYYALQGCLMEKPAYRQIQNTGSAITETKYPTLNEHASEIIQSIIDKVAK